ncbi:MAG: biotin/lipoyl-binding protein, partial [Kofleriaceae bacterium]
MIKNWQRRLCCSVGLVWLVASCAAPDITEGRYQGMIEYEQRALAFEMPGRVVAVVVTRGQQVKAGDVIARQDEALDRDARAVDAGAAAIARAELALVTAGSRIEDVRAAEAQLASARAVEGHAETELARERQLVARGATPRARADALEAELAAATGN